MTTEDRAELSDLAAVYADETGLPHIICTALLLHDVEPTRAVRDRIDRIGLSTTERGWIAPLLSSPDPIQ